MINPQKCPYYYLILDIYNLFTTVKKWFFKREKNCFLNEKLSISVIKYRSFQALLRKMPEKRRKKLTFSPFRIILN